MPKMTGAAAILAAAVEENIAKRYDPERKKEKYIHPSSLARGCIRYIAYELMDTPKPELEPRVQRVLDAGNDGHRRIERYLGRLALAREVFFADQAFKIRGYCDAIVYIPPEKDPEHAGFHAVEVKTTGASEFERIVDEGQPKEEHVLQCQIYMWGIQRHYDGAIPLRSGIIFYENRNTLEHHLFSVQYDETMMESLLGRVKTMWEQLEGGQISEDYLPLDHWYHRYCPYLDICELGQRALEYQKEHREGMPDHVLAGIIAKRIVRKQRREGGKAKRKKGPRSLEELAAQLDWE